MTTYHKSEFLLMGTSVRQISRLIVEGDILTDFTGQDAMYITHFLQQTQPGLAIDWSATKDGTIIGKVKKSPPSSLS